MREGREAELCVRGGRRDRGRAVREAERGSSGAGDGFEVTKFGHGRVALIGFPSELEAVGLRLNKRPPQAARILVVLMCKHEFDARYQKPEDKLYIAQLYFPLIGQLFLVVGFSQWQSQKMESFGIGEAKGSMPIDK
ncbi:hypothetical protein Syun_018404 [Stephania yunnanensis]|uniref:Uncharacterized protein n=1 Tax=Stephania yunnanensis TaxID=152371 RepID=A0AAP0NUZ9_9MAGN